MPNNQPATTQTTPVSPNSTKAKSSGVNKFLVIVLFMMTALLFFVVGAFALWFFQDKLPDKLRFSPSPSPLVQASAEPEVSPEEMVPSPQVSAAPQASPEIPAKSDLELLREAFATKYSHTLAETEVNIGKQAGPYVSGGIHFSGEMGGGWFLAYKGADGWIIVADGNGTVPCEAIEPYDFPVDMVPECWDDSTSTLITR